MDIAKTWTAVGAGVLIALVYLWAPVIFRALSQLL